MYVTVGISTELWNKADRCNHFWQDILTKTFVCVCVHVVRNIKIDVFLYVSLSFFLFKVSDFDENILFPLKKIPLVKNTFLLFFAGKKKNNQKPKKPLSIVLVQNLVSLSQLHYHMISPYKLWVQPSRTSRLVLKVQLHTVL